MVSGITMQASRNGLALTWRWDFRNKKQINRIEKQYDRHTKAKRLDKTRRHGDPQGGILQSREGKIWPDLSQDPRVLWLHDHREGQARQRERRPRVWEEDRRNNCRPSRRSRRAEAALPALGALRHQR